MKVKSQSSGYYWIISLKSACTSHLRQTQNKANTTGTVTEFQKDAAMHCRVTNITLPCVRGGSQFPVVFGVKTSFSCCVTRIKVVRRLSSFNLEAPTYVHVDRIPPRMSWMVFSTSPRYSISTVFPSEALPGNRPKRS